MNIEEQLRNSNKLLESLLSHTSNVSEEEARQVQEEIEDIEESIEKYQAEVDELQKKLANEENYKRVKSDFEVNERPIIEELISESISNEREEIFKSSQLYRKQQGYQTKMLGVYNEEVVKLKDEIKNIEARLNKDAIAKKRGLAKRLHLSDSEVVDLQLELEYKKELIEEGNQVMEICADEIRRYGRLINENNMRLKALTDKEQKLTQLINARAATPKSELDQYQIRLDKDELSKKLSVLEALKNRKNFLTYNPAEEIRKQIQQNKDFLASLENGVSPVSNETVQASENNELSDDKDISEDSSFVEENNEKENNNEQVLNTDDSKVNNENASTLFEPSFEESKEPNDEAEKKKEEEAIDSSVVPEKSIIVREEPRELVKIFDAPEPLREQKLSEKFKEVWNKYRKQAIAFAVAAAVTVTSAIGFSKLGKDDKKEVPSTSITQQDDMVKDDSNEEDNFVVQDNKQEESKDDTSAVDKEETSNPSLEDTSITEKPSSVPNVQMPSTNVIPEVEIEKEPEIETPSNNQEQFSPVLEGIINNAEIETTLLQSEGEFVEIPFRGELIYVEYGATQDEVPSEIIIKYDGADMYIYSPINTKALR